MVDVLQLWPQRLEWITPELYNKFPSVEDSRKEVSEKTQISLTNNLSNALKNNNNKEAQELVGKIGTGIIHSHHLIEEGEAILGVLENLSGKVSLISKPTSFNEGDIPITWMAKENKFVAIEGVKKSPNLPQELLRTSEKVQKFQPLIAQALKEAKGKLVLSIDPRVIFSFPAADCYFETNDEKSSILTQKNGSEELNKIVVTYFSTKDPTKEVKNCYKMCSSDGNRHQ